MWSGCETAAGLRGVTRKGDMSCGSVIKTAWFVQETMNK